ncbi:MAG: tyrosine-type recombinase/integrase, partial [Candidatus Hodarchaeales archaeon]
SGPFEMPKFKRHKTKYPGVYFIIGTSVASGKSERIYYITYRVNGKRFEEKAGRQFQDDMTPAKASIIRAKKINGELLPNVDKRKEKDLDSWTLNKLWKEYKENKTYIKRIEEYEYMYNNHLKNRLGEKTVEEIKPSDVEKLRKRLAEKYKPSTYSKILRLLNQIVNYGTYRQLCNPLSFKIKIPKYDDRKTEDLTTKQLKCLMEVLEYEENKDAVAIMKLALFTGMRKSEMLKLQWDDVDFERGFINIREPKGVISHKIPLNKLARNVLNNHPRMNNSPYVFPSTSGGLRYRTSFDKPLRRICKNAGLPKDFRPLHGLRHVYASMLASSGQVDMYTLQKLLTHKSPQMTQRYAHLRDEALKKASNLVGELISQAVNGAEDKKVVNIDDYRK